MDYLVIDAHAHLWLKQDTKVEDLPIRTTYNGRSFFMKEEVQMLPPFMIDGKNSAEVFLSNMDYAQVSAAIITQEYIDGDQNEYLEKIQQKYPDRFFCCGLVDARFPGYALKAEELIKRGFKAIKVPAQRLITSDKRIFLTCNEMMQMLDNMGVICHSNVLCPY